MFSDRSHVQHTLFIVKDLSLEGNMSNLVFVTETEGIFCLVVTRQDES